MATVPAAIKFRGNLLDRPGVPIVTIGTGLTVLNSDALAVSHATTPAYIMGDAGGLEADVLTNGDHVVRQTVPSGSRFLDLMGLAIGDDAVPSAFATAPVIQLFGKIGGPTDPTIDSKTPHTVSKFNAAFPEPSSWWIPLVDGDGEASITLPTALSVFGEDSGGYGYGLTLPKYVRVAGVSEIACVITTAGALTSSATTDSAMIIGRYTT